MIDEGGTSRVLGFFFPRLIEWFLEKGDQKGLLSNGGSE